MRRPDVFTLDYGHPLAQGLVFAGLGPGSDADYPDSSISRIPVTITNYNESSYWTYKDGRYWLKPGALTTYPSAQVGAFGVLAAAPEWCVSCRIDATTNSDAAYPSVICRPIGNADVLGFRRATRTSCVRFGYTEIKSVVWGATEDLAFLGDNFWGWNRRVDAVDFYKNEALSTIATAASYGWGNVSRMFCSDATTTSFFDAFVADLLIHNRALSPAEVAILADRTDPMLGGLVREVNPVAYFDFGASAGVAIEGPAVLTAESTLALLGQKGAVGPATVTASASLGMGGVKGVSSPLNIVGTASLEASGQKSTSGPATITAASAIGMGGIKAIAGLDKEGPAVVAASSTVGIGGVKGGVGAAVLGADSAVEAGGMKGAAGQAWLDAMGEFYAVRGPDDVPITADEIGRMVSLKARNYSAVLAKRNYTARLS